MVSRLAVHDSELIDISVHLELKLSVKYEAIWVSNNFFLIVPVVRNTSLTQSIRDLRPT